MSGRGGGSASAPSRRDEKTISFLLWFSFRLLSAAHVYMVNLFLARVCIHARHDQICVIREFEDPVPVVDRMQVGRGDDIGGGPYRRAVNDAGLDDATADTCPAYLLQWA